MSENQKITSTVTKGLIISLIIIAFGTVLQIMGQGTNRALSSIQYVFLVGGLIWACISYAKDMQGNVTFGNVFAHGFKTAALVTALVAVVTIIMIKFIFPESVDAIIDMSRLEMEKQGKLSAQQIDDALAITKKFLIPFMMGGIVVVFLIVGLIASLIGAAVAKKNPNPNPF
jgi:hypothetical protein